MIAAVSEFWFFFSIALSLVIAFAAGVVTTVAVIKRRVEKQMIMLQAQAAPLLQEIQKKLQGA